MEKNKQSNESIVSSGTDSALHLLILSIALFLRVVIGQHPYSGQNNHHGSKTAYGGDYEAQRHWMELTLHLPIQEWYTYDAQYWGLDYPPLTAYGSYVCGLISHYLVGEETVALYDSRGYETEDHKYYMRGTVIVLDILIYLPVILILANRLSFSPMVFYLVLTQPALLLIDHGHFQYNAVCLGFALLSYHFFTLDGQVGWNAIMGSISFCLALNWKQMALYYAPAVFAYLLGQCFSSSATDNKSIIGLILSLVIKVGTLGCAVLFTFGILWYPFYHYSDDGLDGLFQVILRIFPFHRGLFEGKVSNIWCVLSMKPLSIQQRISSYLLPKLSLALTLVMMLPFCIMLFCIGKKGMNKSDTATTSPNNSDVLKEQQAHHLKALLWGAAGTSISFFLASFQVHEKSILLPLAPLTLLFTENPNVIMWFIMASTWSLWHLLSVDQLRMPYFLISAIFYIIFGLYMDGMKDNDDNSNDKQEKTTKSIEKDESGSGFSLMKRWEGILLSKLIVPLTSVLMVGLHVMECFITPPSNLPDLFQVLWVVLGCGMNCIIWVTISLRLKDECAFIMGND